MASYCIDHPDIDEQRLQLALRDLDAFEPLHRERPWLAFVKGLPTALLAVLAAELARGNRIQSMMGGFAWPMPGSLMVSLQKPLGEDHVLTHPGLALRHLNDPHYWMTDITQTVDGVDFLLIS